MALGLLTLSLPATYERLVVRGLKVQSYPIMLSWRCWSDRKSHTAAWCQNRTEGHDGLVSVLCDPSRLTSAPWIIFAANDGARQLS